MCAIFHKKGKKKWQKSAKDLKNRARMYKIWKYSEKGHPHAYGYAPLVIGGFNHFSKGWYRRELGQIEVLGGNFRWGWFFSGGTW